MPEPEPALLVSLQQAKDSLEAALAVWVDLEQNVLPTIRQGVIIPDIGQRMGDAHMGIAQGLDRFSTVIADLPDGESKDKANNARGYVLITYNALIVGLLFGRYARLGTANPHEKLLKDAYRLVQGK